MLLLLRIYLMTSQSPSDYDVTMSQNDVNVYYDNDMLKNFWVLLFFKRRLAFLESSIWHLARNMCVLLMQIYYRVTQIKIRYLKWLYH